MVFTQDDLRKLTADASAQPVLSVYARWDPRDPGNASRTKPAWQVELHNGLLTIAEHLESNGNREHRLAFRELRDRVERELQQLPVEQRGRSVAWFIGIDGKSSQRTCLQVPVRHDAVVWDDRPYIWPLVDATDRGLATGVIHVDGEHVRLLHLEHGKISEPENSTYEVELGGWRTFGASADPNRARSQQRVSPGDQQELQLADQREKMFQTAAAAVSSRLDELGWERIILLAEAKRARRFIDRLPAAAQARIAATLDLNVGYQQPHQIATTLEPLLDELWRKDALAALDTAFDRAGAGGAGAVGPDDTLLALAEGRVARLIIDPDYLFPLETVIPELVGGPVELLGERAVCAAIRTGAQVTALAIADSERLELASGMAAILRY